MIISHQFWMQIRSRSWRDLKSLDLCLRLSLVFLQWCASSGSSCVCSAPCAPQLTSGGLFFLSLRALAPSREKKKFPASCQVASALVFESMNRKDMPFSIVRSVGRGGWMDEGWGSCVITPPHLRPIGELRVNERFFFSFRRWGWGGGGIKSSLIKLRMSDLNVTLQEKITWRMETGELSGAETRFGRKCVEDIKSLINKWKNILWIMNLLFKSS